MHATLCNDDDRGGDDVDDEDRNGNQGNCFLKSTFGNYDMIMS